MHDSGRGVEQDDAEAVRWYRLAAEQGDATSQWNLAESHYHGQGVPRDTAEAAGWFRLAAEQGYRSSADPAVSLGSLSVEGGTLAPRFDPNVRAYTVSGTNGWFRVRASTKHQSRIDIFERSAAGEALDIVSTFSLAGLEINGVPQGSTFNTTLRLSAGENLVSIVVRAGEGRSRSYRLVACAGGTGC